MIDPKNALIAVQSISWRADVLIGAAIRGGRDVHNGFSGSGAAGENRRALLVRKDGAGVRDSIDPAEAQIGSEKEGSVLEDGTTHVGVKIVKTELRPVGACLIQKEVI